MFWYFLDKNHALFIDGKKKIEDSTLVALTIMIAESRAEEKETMISVIMKLYAIKMLSLMTITRERQPHPAKRQDHGCSDPCAGQRPHYRLRHLH